MVRRAFAQRSLVEVLLPDGDKLWDPALRTIDDVLMDDELVDHVVEALSGRHRQSRQPLYGGSASAASAARPSNAPSRWKTTLGSAEHGC